MKKLFLFILLFLPMLLSGVLFSREVVQLPGLEKPDSLTIDGRELYITDKGTIFVYSLEDFVLKRKFGNQGEGPGEFKILPFDRVGLRIAIQGDIVLVNSIGRISYFTKEGNFIKHMFKRKINQLYSLIGVRRDISLLVRSKAYPRQSASCGGI